MASGSLQAHHSLAGAYALGKDGQVTGSLTAIRLVNPHGSMKLDVKNPDGSMTEWVLTTGGASTLARLGVGKTGPNALNAGDMLTVTFVPAADGHSPLGFLKTITYPDGHVVTVSRGDPND
jgi:hypothetical protein